MSNITGDLMAFSETPRVAERLDTSDQTSEEMAAEIVYRS
jgi:hypothetical protein